MSLSYLPKLPEGLHPFYCIFRGYQTKKLSIISDDKPIRYGYRCFTYDDLSGFYMTKTYHIYDDDKKEWISQYTGSEYIKYYDYSVIYTNSDIKQGNTIKFPKNVEATEISIDGGDMRNMQKGMVWNVGEAISISPPEAPQICTFSSSNPDVCTVDETGKIVAVGEGECIITITSKM
nr:MAG TPA: tail tube protein [Caudoviricetes sp.]